MCNKHLKKKMDLLKNKTMFNRLDLYKNNYVTKPVPKYKANSSEFEYSLAIYLNSSLVELPVIINFRSTIDYNIDTIYDYNKYLWIYLCLKT